MAIEPRKAFGIVVSLGRSNANRLVTVRNLNTKEFYPEVVNANAEGFAGIDCANFLTKFSNGDVIRFSLHGVSEGQVDVIITSDKSSSIKKTLSLTARDDTGAL